MEELKRKTDVLLRSVLLSVGRTGLALRLLDREYKSFTYSSLPYKEMGFSSLEKYIKSIPEVASLSRDVDGEYVVHGVASEADKHVAKLIAKQRKPKRKAKAKARRPVHASMHKPGVGRSAALHRAPMRKSPQAVPFRGGVAPFRGGVTPSRGGAAPRFVPPRMMKRGASQGSSQSITRAMVEQEIAQKVQQQAKIMAAPASLNSSRTVPVVSPPVFGTNLPQHPAGNKINGMASTNRQVTVVSHQEKPPHKKSWKKKAKSPGSGPNWGGMEVTFKTDYDNQNEFVDRTVKVPNSSNERVDSLSEDDMEIYSRIKKMLDQYPKGMWLKRISQEYKKLYNEELSSEKLQRLKHLPHIARCEVFPGDNVIVYPLKPEEKPSVSHTQPHQANGGSPQQIEIYTLRPQDLPDKGTSIEVSISHVESPAHFTIHYKHMWDSLDALSTKLNEFFQNPSNKKDPLPTLKQGMFCCAQFTEDEAWYRARITEIPTQGDTPQAHVIYVDFGNNEIIPVSRLCMLRKEHAELPMMAVLCALDGAIPMGGEKKWSAASVKRFEELCSVAEVLHMTVLRAEGHHLYVELVDSEGNNVAATLEKEGYSMLQRDTDSSSTSSSTRSSLSTSSVTPSSSTDSFVSVTTKTSSASSSGQSSAVSTSDSIRREGGDSEERKPIAARPFLRHRLLSKDEESQKIPERVQIPDEEFIDVFVCNVHSTDNICVNLSGGEYAEKLLALEQSMLCHYEDSTAEETVKAVPGSICAVYSQEIHSDGLWYRVKVLKVKGDKVLIEYMDYGDKGIIPITSLWSIPSRFLELPFQACTVSLHGLPKTKNPEVLLKVKHMTLNKDIVAQVIKRDGNTASVELYDTSSEVDININTMLQRLVIPDEDMAPLLPKVGEQVEAFVTYVTPEGHVFVQIPGGGTMRLHELMEDIAEHYSGITKAAEFVSSPHKDKMCCAHCSDGVWYRAIVTNVFPEREVEVQYVDFGNTEVLPLSSLREPTRAISHVNSLPFQALECKLEGTDKQGLTEEQAEMITERNVFLEVVQLADVPLVRLFVSSEDEEDALVNLGEVLGLETEEQSETFDEAASAGIDSSTLEYHDDDKDSVTSESSTEASKPVEDDNMTTSLLSKQWVDICILEADNPSKFRFQCLELLQQSEELEEKIQQYYTGRSRTPLRDIRPGVFCAVYHVEDDMWYRAVIKAPFSRQQTCVRFADYGDFGLVPSANLQALPDEFRELPPMAVEGCLHGVEPVGEDLAQWSQEAIDRFGELTTDKKLVAKPRGVASHSRLTNKETKVSLELFDTSEGNEDVLIADVLINEGLAKKINES